MGALDEKIVFRAYCTDGSNRDNAMIRHVKIIMDGEGSDYPSRLSEFAKKHPSVKHLGLDIDFY